MEKQRVSSKKLPSGEEKGQSAAGESEVQALVNKKLKLMREASELESRMAKMTKEYEEKERDFKTRLEIMERSMTRATNHLIGTEQRHQQFEDLCKESERSLNEKQAKISAMERRYEQIRKMTEEVALTGEQELLRFQAAVADAVREVENIGQRHANLEAKVIEMEEKLRVGNRQLKEVASKTEKGKKELQKMNKKRIEEEKKIKRLSQTVAQKKAPKKTTKAKDQGIKAKAAQHRAVSSQKKGSSKKTPAKGQGRKRKMS